MDADADSCELVAVRIERTSANSRRIYGDITVAAPLQDVWAILTDYNRLAIHVPNLVESKIERVTSSGEMGDGQFQCRLYQKGAQRIIGFEFGASVTMDMREIVVSSPPQARTEVPGTTRQERKITFKCCDSFFFQEFDGEWKVQESCTKEGDIETLLSYVVDVRPKGPVPVAALEWRIREDVPTNLRAVKKAALAVGFNGVMAARRGRSAALALPNAARVALANDARGKVQWYRDETMEAYLTDK
jgi:Polyketide cyclase / dehydrase and lipid transport